MLRKQGDEKPEKHPSIKPIAFGERSGPEPYNASEIVALDDSKLLFCDNNIGDALFELRLAADGKMAGPLIRRALEECLADYTPFVLRALGGPVTRCVAA